MLRHGWHCTQVTSGCLWCRSMPHLCSGRLFWGRCCSMPPVAKPAEPKPARSTATSQSKIGLHTCLFPRSQPLHEAAACMLSLQGLLLSHQSQLPLLPPPPPLVPVDAAPPAAPPALVSMHLAWSVGMKYMHRYRMYMYNIHIYMYIHIHID